MCTTWNLSSQHLLSKILMVSASQMYVKRGKERTQPSSKLHSAPPTCSKILDGDILATNFAARVLRDRTFSCHWELVHNFLRRCSPREFPEMGGHLKHYIRYFTRLETSHHDDLEYCIKGMILLGKDVADAVEVDLTVMEGILEEKYKALDILRDLGVKTTGESSSWMQITDYNVREEALISEIGDLQSRMSTCSFGNIHERGTIHEKDPATYFEECRTEALLLFGLLFPEPV